MPIIRKIQRIGHSLNLCIPREVITHLRIKKGDYVVWDVDKDKRVIVEKLTPKKHPGFFLPGSGWLKRER